MSWHRASLRSFASAVLIVAWLSAPAQAATLTQANGDPIPSLGKICLDASSHTTGGLAAVFASATCMPPGQTAIGAPCNTEQSCATEKARVLASGVTCETTWLHGVNDDGCAIDPLKGEVLGLNPWNDVQTSYNTFQPLPCKVTFSVVSRGTALFHDAFGWYNAVPGQAPDASDLHVMLGCNSQVGDTASLDVVHEPAYKGGQIGYFLLTPENRAANKACAGGDCCASVQRFEAGVGYAYFTEPSHNPEAAVNGKPYVHFIAYDSRLTPAKFYFAWEDLYQPSGSDFTDVVVSVEGAECSGGGEDCQTTDGAQGPCGLGTRACKNGVLACVPRATPHSEACNGIDDDCNGAIDDDAPCPQGDTCFRGQCQPSCKKGEFPCAVGQQCDDASGLCLEAACIGQTCAAGQVCSGGVCSAPCQGVVCPGEKLCLANECVDLCAKAQCAVGQVCSKGACIAGCTSCGGLTCKGSEQCQETTGHCVDPTCAAPCASGFACRDGACVDECTISAVHCPMGGACQAGACQAAAASGPNGSAGGGADGPLDFGTGGGENGVGVGAGASAGAVATRTRALPASASCSCAVPGGAGASSHASELWVLLALGLLSSARRRAARHSSSDMSLSL